MDYSECPLFRYISERRKLMAEDKKKPVRKIEATTEKRSISSELGKYAMDEIIVPKSKEVMRDMFTGIVNMFADAARGSLDKFLYPNGDAPRKNQGNSQYYTGTTNYTSFSRPLNDYKPSRPDPISTRSGCSVKRVWVKTEADAKDIIGTLKEDIENYGKAKVATLYEQIGERTTEADFSYGWTVNDNIGYFYDTKSPDPDKKWYIDLPQPHSITTI